MVKFFIYELVTGFVFLMLNEPPINSDFLETGDVFETNYRRASGVKWNKVGIWENLSGVELDASRQYVYDLALNEITDIGASYV